MIATPPVSAGSLQSTPSELSPALTASSPCAPGTVLSVVCADVADHCPSLVVTARI